MNDSPYHIIKAPVITEESTLQSDTRNQYTFKVDPKANKAQIRDAIERFFNVKVVSVNTMNYAGQRDAAAAAVVGHKASWKKAVVTLRDGDSR